MQEIKNEFIRYWLEDGMLCSEFIKPVVVGFEEMRQMIALRHEISKESSQYWLYDARNVTSMTKGARDYAEVYGQDFLYASAVIVNSHVTMFMFNIFVKIKTSRIPFQAFKTKETAAAWLQELMVKNKN